MLIHYQYLHASLLPNLSCRLVAVGGDYPGPFLGRISLGLKAFFRLVDQPLTGIILPHLRL